MKSICRISNIPLWKSDLLLGLDLADEHPLFKAKRSIIFDKKMIHRFALSENVLEKRLIYLATLHATYLVEFNAPAEPSLHLMESTYFQLQRLAEWVCFAEFKLAKVVSFPQYVIRKDNADLGNIRSWLDSLEDIRSKVFRKEIERDKNAELLQKHDEIKREIIEANFFGKAFTPKLAKWALEVCDIGARHPNYSKWMKILCTPLSEAFIYDVEDIIELKDMLQEGLPNLEHNPQAISVMFQMKHLLAEHKKGFTEFDIFSNKIDTEVAGFEIVEEDSETHQKVTHKINQHLLNVPTEEPVRSQYEKKVEYFIAKAKWDIAQRMKEHDLGKDSI
jgi:hypothetical protein